MTLRERLALFSWSKLKPDILRLRTIWLIVFFFALKFLVHSVEDVPFVQRTVLPGADLAMRFTKDSARRTVVVGITSDDVAHYFGAIRPLPPERLLRVIDTLLRLDPATLVVDVFTEDSLYTTLKLPSSPTIPIVWAQSADTSSGNPLRVLGGRPDARRASALAAMLAEEDGLVRRVRLRFQREGTRAQDRETLALATISACRAAPRAEQSKLALPCKLARNVPSDTSSVALRAYIREPAFFTLGDALLAAKSGEKGPFTSQIMVLGFVDGSDQVVTPFGIRPGPWIVADAIETLMDERGLIRRPPLWFGFGLDALAMLLVIAVARAYRDEPHRAAMLTLGLGVVGYVGTRFIVLAFNYWTSFLPMMLGVWAESLYDEHRKSAKEHKDSSGTAKPKPALTNSEPAQPATPAIATSVPAAESQLMQIAPPARSTGSDPIDPAESKGSDPIDRPAAADSDKVMASKT